MRWVALVVVVLIVPLGSTALAASSHRNVCHTQHTCPSDHATYVWKGLRCVKPTSDERTAAFKRKVVYQGRKYFCKRA